MDDKNKNSEKVTNDQILQNIEDELVKLEEITTKKIKSYANRINCELKESIDLSADATSYRQYLIDDRTHFYYKLYREMPKLKKMKKTHFEFYSTKYPIKVNSTEKRMLIEADISYYETKIDYYQNHIDFLTDTVKTIDHVIYSVKTKVELYNATGLA